MHGRRLRHALVQLRLARPLILLLLVGCTTAVELRTAPTRPSSDRAPSKPAVGSDDLLLRESYSLRSRTGLRAAEVDRDLDVLLHALEHGYGGRKYVDGPSFSRALASLRRLRDRAASFTDSASLCDAIDEILLALPDSHIHARRQDAGFGRHREQSVRRAGVGRNVGSAEAKTWSLHHRDVAGKRVPVLSMLTLPPAQDDSWSGFRDAIADIIRSAPALVLDLRGNQGGADTMPRMLAAALYGTDELPTLHARRIESQTPETLALAVNVARLKTMKHTRRNEPVPGYVRVRLDETLRKYQAATRGELAGERIEHFAKVEVPAALAFTRPIVVLIDAECASACESALEALELHPHVLTVGENTTGAVHFGNMGIVVLPNSQIVVQMATDFWQFRDHRSVEKIGYTPKVRVPHGEDALDVALAKLAGLLK